MLSGDNGILKQAGNAKTQTDIAEEKELLQTSALAAISKEKYGNISKEKLDIELDKTLGVTNYSSEEVDEGIQVTFKSNRTYIVDNDGNVEKAVPIVSVATLQEKYGENVLGYPAKNGVEGWQLFYADQQNKEVFLISTNVVPPTDVFGNTQIPLKSNVATSNYTLEDFDKTNLIYSKNYNSIWLGLANATYKKTSATAYLCDYDNWNENYKSGSAKYAVGGPTIEMFVASYNNIQVKDLNIDNINERGYPSIATGTISEGLYNVKKDYWLASPSNSSNARSMLYLFNTGTINDDVHNTYQIHGVRPIVCFPISAIQLSEDGTLSIK